jgi:hypothetical protein
MRICEMAHANFTIISITIKIDSQRDSELSILHEDVMDNVAEAIGEPDIAAVVAEAEAGKTLLSY